MAPGNAPFAPLPQILRAAATLGILLALAAAATASQQHHEGESESGSCWKLRRSDGSCIRLLKSNVTRESCCSGRHRRGWAGDPSADAGRNSVISDPPPMCSPCSPSCTGVKCGEDRKCVVRGGTPRCVCSPQCHLKHKAPVCGSDERTYVSECHLLKRACRKKRRLLVAHYGPCQTCSGVRCGGGKTCVLDEKLTPRCVRCPTMCPALERPRPICGGDNRTYASPCHLKRASCRAKKEIPRAYKGPCRESVSCNSVRCWRDQRCLVDVKSGKPQCTWCGALSICKTFSRQYCASDGRIYPSWCALRHEACRSGRALTPALHHQCSNTTKPDNCKEDANREDKQRKQRRRQRNREKEPQTLDIDSLTPVELYEMEGEDALRGEAGRTREEEEEEEEEEEGGGEAVDEEEERKKEEKRNKRRRRMKKGCKNKRGKRREDRRKKGEGE